MKSSTAIPPPFYIPLPPSICRFASSQFRIFLKLQTSDMHHMNTSTSSLHTFYSPTKETNTLQPLLPRLPNIFYPSASQFPYRSPISRTHSVSCMFYGHHIQAHNKAIFLWSLYISIRRSSSIKLLLDCYLAVHRKPQHDLSIGEAAKMKLHMNSGHHCHRGYTHIMGSVFVDVSRNCCAKMEISFLSLA